MYQNIDFNLIIQNWCKQNNIACTLLSCIDSTNNWSKTQNTTEPTIVIAREQTQGRGRNQNTWTSNKNTQLLASFCFQTNLNIQPVLSAKIGLALARSLSQTFTSAAFQIKPPNDIYLNQKKLAGILIEIISQGHKKQIIVGIGLNILSAPIETSICLADLYKSNLPNSELITKDQIENWLSIFWKQLYKTIQDCDQLLTNDEQKEIAKLLYFTKQKSEDFKTIDQFGNLHFLNSTINWTEL